MALDYSHRWCKGQFCLKFTFAFIQNFLLRSISMRHPFPYSPDWLTLWLTDLYHPQDVTSSFLGALALYLRCINIIYKKHLPLKRYLSSTHQNLSLSLIHFTGIHFWNVYELPNLLRDPMCTLRRRFLWARVLSTASLSPGTVQRNWYKLQYIVVHHTSNKYLVYIQLPSVGIEDVAFVKPGAWFVSQYLSVNYLLILCQVSCGLRG